MYWKGKFSSKISVFIFLSIEKDIFYGILYSRAFQIATKLYSLSFIY